MKKKCSRCGSDAYFGFKKGDSDPFVDYCHECFEIDHPDIGEEYDPVEVKKMAMEIISKRMKEQ